MNLASFINGTKQWQHLGQHAQSESTGSPNDREEASWARRSSCFKLIRKGTNFSAFTVLDQPSMS